MNKEEILDREKRLRLRIETTSLVKMAKETAKVIKELDMPATAKIIEDQAERTNRALDDLIPEGKG